MRGGTDDAQGRDWAGVDWATYLVCAAWSLGKGTGDKLREGEEERRGL